MLTRVLGIPAALVVLVTAPTLVVRTVTPTPPEAPPTATLKVAVTGDAGGSGHPIYLHVAAKGAAPDLPGTLADAGGLHPASVSSAANSYCRSAPVRHTGKGSTPWCLAVANVDAGHELTGSVTGGTTLTLTVTRRNAFWWLPLLVLSLGFAVALLLPLMSRRLQRFVGELAVSRLLERNDHAGRDRVADMRDWVKQRFEDDKPIADIFKTLSSIVGRAPAKVHDARTDLQRALNHTDLPETPAYGEAARKEARRTGFVMSDFVGEDDKLRTTPVAVGWKIGLEQLAAKRDQLKTLEMDIATKLKPECRTAPTNALAQARALLGTVDEPDDVEDISAAVTDAQAAYNVAWDNRDCRIAALADATREAPVESVDVSAPGAEEAAPPTFDLHGGLLRAETALGWAGVVLAAAFVLVLAGTTVYEAAYESKPAFAGFPDYFALFSAALASSAATSVLGLLAYWRPAPATPA